MPDSSPHSVQDDFFIVWATLKGHPTLDPHAALRRIEEQLQTDQHNAEEWKGHARLNEQRLDELKEQLETLDEALREILDVTEKWTRKMTDEERLLRIFILATAALSNLAEADEFLRSVDDAGGAVYQ